MSDSYLKMKLRVNEKKSRGEEKWMGMGRKQSNLRVSSPSPLGSKDGSFELRNFNFLPEKCFQEGA